MPSTVYLFKKNKNIKTELISTIYVKCWFTTFINRMGAARPLLVSFALLFFSLLAEKHIDQNFIKILSMFFIVLKIFKMKYIMFCLNHMKVIFGQDFFVVKNKKI